MTKRRGVLASAVLGAFALFVRPTPGLAEEDCVTIGSRLLDKYVAAVNAHDTSAFGEIHTENYIQHSGRSPNGLTAQIENFRTIFARMPDVQATVEDRIIQDDKVVARMTFTATHTQPMQGIAQPGAVSRCAPSISGVSGTESLPSIGTSSIMRDCKTAPRRVTGTRAWKAKCSRGIST